MGIQLVPFVLAAPFLWRNTLIFATLLTPRYWEWRTGAAAADPLSLYRWFHWMRLGQMSLELFWPPVCFGLVALLASILVEPATWCRSRWWSLAVLVGLVLAGSTAVLSLCNSVEGMADWVQVSHAWAPKIARMVGFEAYSGDRGPLQVLVPLWLPVTVGVAGLAALTAVFCKARALGQARRYRTMTGVIVISLTLGVAMAKALYDLLTANFSPQIGWLWPSLGAAGGMLIVAGWNLGRILRAWNPRGQSAPRTAPAPRSRREEIRQWVAAAGALLILTVVLWNPWEKLTVWMHDRMGGGWTGGQRIVGTMPNDPEELRTYLHHPDYRVRFSAAASIVVRHMVGYRDDLPKGPGYLVAHPPFTQADIDDAFQVLIETYARRDPTITGLQQYLGENLHRIFDRRMLKVFQMALTNEDFLEGGTSESFASGDALELLGKEENPNDGLWGRSLGEWIAQNYDRLKWNGGYFEVKAAPPSVTLGAVPAKL